MLIWGRVDATASTLILTATHVELRNQGWNASTVRSLACGTPQTARPNAVNATIWTTVNLSGSPKDMDPIEGL